MKTEWQIVECPHEAGPAEAIRRSRFNLLKLSRGIWTVVIEAFQFTDQTFLVVVKATKRKFGASQVDSV